MKEHYIRLHVVQYIILDREVLTPSPCELHMDTDINSHADETVMESYPNIPLDDVSRFSNVLFPPGCVTPFHTNFKDYIPLAVKDLSISLGSKNPNIPLNTCKCSTDIALLGTLVLKLYVNVIQSPEHHYQIIKKTFLSPSGIKPATYVLSHNISVTLPTFLPMRQLLLF